MPYTREKARRGIRQQVSTLPYRKMEVGDLTYTLFQIVVNWMFMQPERFDSLARAMGAIQSLDDELRRQHVHPYEDLKREKNGPVLPYIIEYGGLGV